jgi:3-polyprenyl-4-hydroxybenzoate decarboxylase
LDHATERQFLGGKLGIDATAKLPEEGARHQSTYLAAGSVAHSHVDARTPKRVISGESAAGPAR